METYKGYTIEEDPFYNPYSKNTHYCYYPTEKGRQDDADYDGESFVYCGNAKWADSIEEAKDEIDALTDQMLDFIDTQDLARLIMTNRNQRFLFI